MNRVSIDFRADDTPDGVRRLLTSVDPVYSRPKESWVVDLARCEYLGPDAACILFALKVWCTQQGGDVSFLAPETEKVRAFWIFSGLEHFLSNAERPAPDPQSETIPLTHFYTASWDRPHPLVRLIKRHISLSSDSEDYLRICVNEVIQNIEDHADSAIGGVFCARYVDTRKEVRVAVVDHGVGILRSLSRQYPDLIDDADAARRVIEGKHSSLSRPNNMGLGLSNLAAIIRLLQGNLLLISGRAALVQ